MKMRVFQKIKMMGFLLLLAGTLVSTVHAEVVRTATVRNLRGEALVKRSGKEWEAAKEGMILNVRDEIKTSEQGTTELFLDEGKTGTLELDRKSHLKLDTMEIQENTGEKKTLLDLALGRVLVHAEKLQGKSRFEVKTPTSTAGVRGTTFEVAVEEE